MNKQLTAMQKWLAKQSIDVAFINEPNTIAYLSGYESDPHERILALTVFAGAPPFLLLLNLKRKMQ